MPQISRFTADSLQSLQNQNPCGVLCSNIVYLLINHSLSAVVRTRLHCIYFVIRDWQLVRITI